MGRVVRGVENAVKQLAELLGRRRRIDVEQRVEGLRRGQMVRLGANAADPRAVRFGMSSAGRPTQNCSKNRQNSGICK